MPQKLSSNKFSQPWVTSKCRKKKRLNNKARSSGLTRDCNDYLCVKKLAQYECRATYHEYVSHLIDPHTNNKKFWSHIKSCCKDHTGISTLIVEGNTITDDLDKANALNNQFVSAFTQENVSTIPGSYSWSFISSYGQY